MPLAKGTGVEFNDVVRRRRMVRNYDPSRRPDPAVVDRLVELAVRAPTAGFSQGWHFLVLDEPLIVRTFWSATTDPASPADSWLSTMATAPVLILALSEPDAYLQRYAEPDKGWTDRDVRRWPIPYWDVDTGMASLLVLLGAVNDGLASCFFGVPANRAAAVRAVFDIPPGFNIVGVISLGYPEKDRPSPSLKRGRRPMTDVRSYRRFGQSSRFT